MTDETLESLPVARADPDPRHLPNTLWPGSSDFARIFGRLRTGKMTILEAVDPYTEGTALRIVLPMMVHQLQKGGSVLIIPPRGMSLSRLYELLQPAIPVARLLEKLRFVVSSKESPTPADLQGATLPLIGPASTHPLFASGGRTLGQGGWDILASEAKTNLPSLMLMAVSGIVDLSHEAGVTYTTEEFPGLVVRGLGMGSRHMLAFGQAQEPLFAALREFGTTHLKITELHGRSVVIGTRPPSGSYYLGPPHGRSPYALKPLH